MTMDPSLQALLEVSRDTLRREVMPSLFGDSRYRAAMIANALAILQRSIRTQGHERFDEADALQRLYPEIPADTARDGDESDVAIRRRMLIRDIRHGRLDPAECLLVASFLAPRVRARLAISQPDYRRIGPAE